jgi:type II secretory ATPase GspE/PulE/Tfp pilus assembly ATPase PilB-like protein
MADGINSVERGWFAVGPLNEDEKRKAEGLRLGVPFVTLSRDAIAISALVLIPEPLSRTANIVAYNHTDEGIEVALLDLADLPLIDFLRQTHRVQVRLTDRGSIKQALLVYQKHLKEKFAGLVQSGKNGAESLLQHALHSGAQYIHIEPAHAEAAGTVVRYRIEGALREAMRLPEEASRYIVERLKQLAKLFPVATTVQEGSFTFTHEGREVGVAVSTTPTVRGERVSMRLAHDTQSVTGFSLTSLGLHGSNLEHVQNVLHTQKGLVVVAGMDESGKTTMLYTMLDHVTAAHKAVATVEERVEYRLPQVHQSATRPELGLNTAALLRATLRQDPDTVMVANLDDDSLPLAVHASQRGVFVLGGLQTRSVEDAVDRVPEAKLVVLQQLLRRLKPGAATRPLARAEAEVLEDKVHFAKVLAALKAEGVVQSHIAWKDVAFYTTTEADAYKGKAGIQEVHAPGQQGGLTLLEDALFKAVQGLVSIEDVVEMAAN